jgi:GH15 family glucan-1,4-alpha-glucosidase
MVAAPTTSLPERVGGDLNWDYRYCWLRDASLTVRVLSELGYSDEAFAFLSWLLHSTRLTRPELRVFYDVYGGLDGHEEILGHLEGHRRSKPVRVGNAAAIQLQLDTHGEIVDSVARMHRRGAHMDRDTRAMLRQFGEYVCENWWRADQGIWEPRGTPQERTHSRLLCWVTLDRLLELHDAGVFAKLNREKIRDVRDRIRWDIEERCWNPAIGSYTQTVGGSTVDASLLLMSWYGFAKPDDPRLAQTFARIHERLAAGPDLIRREELSGASGEGAFGICCFWAAEHLARGGGSLNEAEEYFQRLLPYANDVGLYGEEIDPVSGDPLGNFPQAFTHVGLIGAALALEERRRSEAGK